jgi:ABC-type transport system involved in cytochrome bd biosynthesis fused ATPase/permease subunit
MQKKILATIKPSRRMLAFTVMLGLAGALAIIAQMTLLSRVVNMVFLSHKGLAQVLLPLVLLVGASILRAGLLWAREGMAQRAAIRTKALLRERVFAHLLALGPAWSTGERTGELAAVLNEGVERLDAYVARYLPQLVLSVLVPLIIIVVIVPVDWFSAVLLLCTGPVIPLLMALVGNNTRKRTQAQWATLSLMSAHFLDVMQGLTTLKMFGRSQEQQERIATISNRFREKTLQVLRSAFLSGAVLEFMTMSAIGVIATTLGVRLLNHGISFERAFFILLLTPEFYRPLQELGVQHHAAMEGEASARRLFEILETPLPTSVGAGADAGGGGDACVALGEGTVPPSVGAGAVEGRGRGACVAHRIGGCWGCGRAPHAPPPRPSATPAPTDAEQSGSINIDITDLSYTYPTRQAPVLDHVTLRLPANACTALVGRSGAGKSTLVNLLMRFMDTSNGTIAANGVPITHFPPEQWREYVALVPQRPYLFYGTVRENIRLARPEAGEDEIMRAAELAGVTAFLDELPHGFDTQVGEQGTQLSAGQAQRVAIARAILKNAPVLILDEPTSSLDPDSEAHIRQSLSVLVRDRTVLVIAHRYNTIAQADRIVVLEHGHVVEEGTLDELALSGGAYAHLPGVANAVEAAAIRRRS